MCRFENFSEDSESRKITDVFKFFYILLFIGVGAARAMAQVWSSEDSCRRPLSPHTMWVWALGSGHHAWWQVP